jgi:hypothetical protein
VKYKPENRKLEVESEVNIPPMTSSTPMKPTNLAVGVIKDNCLHITPLQDVFQMRPIFDPLKLGEEIINIEGDEGDDETSITSKKSRPVLQQVLSIH